MILCVFVEGGIFFSEQQFVNAGDDGVQLSSLGPQQTIAKFGEFIRNFQEDRTTNVYAYAYVCSYDVKFGFLWRIL